MYERISNYMDQKLNDIFFFQSKVFSYYIITAIRNKKEISDSKIFLAQGDFNYKFIYNFIFNSELNYLKN